MIYAKVECFWGCVVRLKDCQLYNMVYQLRYKTLKKFLNAFVHFYLKTIVWKWFNKSAKQRFSKHVFLLQGAAGNSRLKMWVCVNRPSYYLKPLNKYLWVTMSRLLYSRGGQTFFLAGQISMKYCIAGRKKIFALFFLHKDVNWCKFRVFSYRNAS